MWESIANFLTSLFGSGGGDAASQVSGGELALGAGEGAAQAAAGAGSGFNYGGLMDPQLLGLGLQGGQLGYGLANQPGDQGGGQMPANLFGQGNPGGLRQRAQGASADLQARGLDVGAAPDFLQKQLESELGLTPDEFQRIFRLGGGAAGAGGGA